MNLFKAHRSPRHSASLGLWVACLAALLISACQGTGRAQLAAQPAQAQATAATATAMRTPLPSATLTATASPSPTATATATVTQTPTPSPTATLTPTPLPIDELPYITLSNIERITRLVQIPPGPQGALSAGFAFSPTGQTLALDGGMSVRLYDIELGQVTQELHPPQSEEDYAPAGSIAFSPDGKQVARVYHQDRVLVWDLETGSLLTELRAGPQTQALFNLAFIRTNRVVASAGTQLGTGLAVWDLASGELIAENASGSYREDSFAISPAGWMIVQAGVDGTLRFWDPQSGELRGQQIIYACQDAIHGATFSPDGYVLLLQCENEGTRLFRYIPNYYRFGDLTLVGVQEMEHRASGPMSFNRDGALLALAAGAPARQIVFWDMSSESQRMMIGSLPADVRQLAFSPNGRLLAFRLGDGSVELWGSPRP